MMTRFGELEIAPGVRWEPIYRAKENADGEVIDFAWFCPHCGHEYKNRHCAGKQGMHVATCAALPIHQCNPNCKLYRHQGRKYVGGPLIQERSK